MLYDENIYPDPHTYKPERFIKNGVINKDILHPKAMFFGFGRR